MSTHHVGIQRDLQGRWPDEVAIRRLQHFEPPEGFWLAFSGGKDSVVILDLAKRAGVKFEAHYSLTTVDPPELVHFIRTCEEVKIDRPEKTMWQLIRAEGIMPSRHIRWCCRALKESGGNGRTVVTGIRWAESVRRSRRRMVEQCRRQGSRLLVHPIIDWSTGDVWSYIRSRELRYCCLYGEGFARLGCVMCPLQTPGQMQRDMLRWPKIAGAWQRACWRLWEAKPGLHAVHPTAEALWQWWIGGQGAVKAHGEPTLFD